MKQKKQKSFAGSAIARAARETGLPYAAIWYWVERGKIVLPDDTPLLKKLRKGENGRYYLPEEKEYPATPGVT